MQFTSRTEDCLIHIYYLSNNMGHQPLDDHLLDYNEEQWESLL